MSRTPAELARELAAARARLPQAKQELRDIPGIRDVLVGLKTRGGQATEDVVFQVYVETKKPLQQLAPEHRIPPVVAGLPTDVMPLSGIRAEQVHAGGLRITQSACGASYGTLGAVALTTQAIGDLPSGSPVFLTNWHVAEDVGDPVGSGCFCDCCCCACGDVGVLVAAEITQQVDGAIARPNPGVRFSHEILGIGAVRGQGVAGIGTPILKNGQRTGLTRGVVVQDNVPQFTRADDKVFVQQLQVAPVAPDTDMSEGGDSGSVYVNADTRQIVGLHHAGSDADALGNHIAPVASALHITFPVMGTAGSIPLAGAPAAMHGPNLGEAVALLRADLEQSEVGQQWIELWRRHATEVRDLVNHNRAATVAWQQSQGPAFVAHLLKAAREPSHRVPREIGGMRAENVLVAMASVLQREGSHELRAAITEHYLSALQFVPGCDSFDEFSARTRRLLPGRPHGRRRMLT